MTGVALIRRAGELTRQARPERSRWERLHAMVHRAAADIERGRRSEQRRRRARRRAIAGIVVGAGAAVALARTGMHTGR